MKDNFSQQASSYAQFRPVYPQNLYDHILSLTGEKAVAWDCGCGNGQVAAVLSEYFTEVIATDISANQIKHAVQKPNIDYRLFPAENTNIESNSVNLITVAQAIHWFDFDQFYEEVKRVSKPNAIIAVWCYNLLEISPEIDEVTRKLYGDILGDEYWDPERKLIEEKYKTIPFPFSEVESPEFTIIAQWSVDQLIGYFNSWSAVQHYIKKNSVNPVEQLQQEFVKAWGKEQFRSVTFPIFTRIGIVNS